MKSAMEEVTVSLGDRSYPIRVGPGLLGELALELPGDLPRQHAVVITDSNVAGLYLDSVVQSLEKVYPLVHSIRFPAGEESKSLELAWRLWEELAGFSADRKTVLFALGGGVVGDLAGFAAATFMRGVPLVQIPTSLMAQVDSSVGGKTGINLPAAKNMIGSFWQPKGVLIDPLVLNTLPDREFRSGLAEVVKYGVIADEGFLSWLEGNSAAINGREPAAITRLIVRCCEIKAGIVAQDEMETSGLRAILNYGHTFGHAIETVSGYGTWLHGEAVSMGMECAGRLASRMGLLDSSCMQRQSKLLAEFGLPLKLDKVDVAGLLEAMKRDKKRNQGAPTLVLAESIGSVRLVDWPGDELVAGAYLSQE